MHGEEQEQVRMVRRRSRCARCGGGGEQGHDSAQCVPYLPRYFVELLLREAAEQALVVAFVLYDVGQVRGEVGRIPFGRQKSIYSDHECV